MDLAPLAGISLRGLVANIVLGGARIGLLLPPGAVRAPMLPITGGMTLVFFIRAY